MQYRLEDFPKWTRRRIQQRRSDSFTVTLEKLYDNGAWHRVYGHGPSAEKAEDDALRTVSARARHQARRETENAALA
jgi:hypothetical protein